MKLKAKQALMLLGGAATAGVAQTATAHADTVTVKKGDTTWGLAQQHKSSVAQIVKDNHLANNGNLIYVGQQLQINQDDGQNNTPAQSQQATSSQTTATATQTTPVANNDQSQGQVQAPSQQAQQSSQAAVNTSSNYTSGVTGNEAAAKAWIAARESGGNYGARNGQYIGKYQLSASYLGGDYSPAHQEQVADSYVAGRYGSWSNAQAFWQSHGWY